MSDSGFTKNSFPVFGQLTVGIWLVITNVQLAAEHLAHGYKFKTVCNIFVAVVGALFLVSAIARLVKIYTKRSHS